MFRIADSGDPGEWPRLVTKAVRPHMSLDYLTPLEFKSQRPQPITQPEPSSRNKWLEFVGTGHPGKGGKSRQVGSTPAEDLAAALLQQLAKEGAA